jgi:hypothetical protein
MHVYVDQRTVHESGDLDFQQHIAGLRFFVPLEIPASFVLLLDFTETGNTNR